MLRTIPINEFSPRVRWGSLLKNKIAHCHNVISRTLLLLHYKKLNLLIKLVVFVNIYVKCVSCIPVINDSDTYVIYTTNRNQPRIKKSPIYDDVQSYLTKFGYLPESDVEIGNLRTEEQLREAIKNLQTFANIAATGDVDAATRELMRRPRCGLPDIPTTNFRSKRHTLHGQRWHHTNLTWSLRTGHNGSVRRELSRALALWAKHSKLTFQEVNDERADILIEFKKGYHGDGYPFDGPGRILAHAFFPGSGRGGDAHFDEEENWLLDDSDDRRDSGMSLFAVAAHEFGHSLGLSHSSVADALMFPYYKGISGDYDLPNDDRLAIQILYGPRDDKMWAHIPEYRPSVDNGNGYRPGGHHPHPHPHTPATEDPRRRHPYTPPRTTPTTTTTTTSTTTTTTPRPTTRPTRPVYRRPYNPHGPAYQPPAPAPPAPQKPDTCDTTYDAVAVIRRETFIFKDKYIWRIGEKGPHPGYPALTERLWQNLPPNFTRIDAVYERFDKKIVFFIGKYFYVFDANVLMHGYPKPLTDLGLPSTLERVDAAFIWGYNSKTYFFSETMYWKFDEELGRVELDYPRDMSIWRGVGYYIDAVFQWNDGRTYFFKGKGFWKFDDLRMRVENEQPRPAAQFWMGCPPNPKAPTKDRLSSEGRKNKSKSDPNASSKLIESQTAIFLMIILHFVYVYHF